MAEEVAGSNAEEWRPVVGWESYYEVSSEGRLRRILQSPGTVAGTILKQNLGGRKRDYLHVCLCRNGKSTSKAVHRLVAAAFLGPCPPDHNVNHIDGVKANPAARNLEYVTPHQNQQHALQMGLQIRKLTDQDVRAIRELLPTRSQSSLAREYGVKPQTINKIAARKIYEWLP